ncbi:MAG TPA: bifunctional RNase H/acid phosphatase [Actinomycetes bacterium]|nr:bifunctional RNase H/acid phosphatase [Actinomycetes bacterium]
MGRRLIVEADGGSRGNPGPAAYGAVVKDAETGEVLFEEGRAIGVATNNVAEYDGLVAALRAAAEIDASATVEARLDSKLVVEQMSGRWKIKHADMRERALQARDAFPADAVTYVWVPRAKNAHADRLVNAALDGKEAFGAASAAADVVEGKPTRQNVLVGWSTAHPVVTTTHLLRHGETVHTAEKRFSGSGGDDPPLNDVGIEQARLAGKHLAASGGADVIVTSPMTRTRQTADIVAEHLGAEVVVENDLRECNFGSWDGQTFAEVQASDQEALDAWLASTAVAPPGGESFDDVEVRVRAARDRILEEFEGSTLVVVTHVTPLKTLLRLALDAPSHAYFRLEIKPASLSTIAWFGDGNVSVRSVNEVPHLGR